MKEKDKATIKAKDLIRMGVSRARLLVSQKRSEVDVESAPSSLVVE